MIEILSKLLLQLPPESAHNLAVLGLRLFPSTCGRAANPPPRLSTTVKGLGALLHPVGLAAGFDKNAECIAGLVRLGFSFIECGTVTPKPQPGNDKPRIWRLKESQSLINRLGFNNVGVEAFLKNIENQKPIAPIPIGINLGKNKATAPEAAIEDYIKGFERLKDVGSYFVCNLSSPNTPGLRSLANREFFKLLASRLQNDLERIWIKLSPDIDKKSQLELFEIIASLGFAGLILTNTTMVERPFSGGLSGRDLAEKSLDCLENAYSVFKGSYPLIACGGISTGQDVLERLKWGAHAVQIYTAFIYRGPRVINKILCELEAALDKEGYKNIDEVRGSL